MMNTQSNRYIWVVAVVSLACSVIFITLRLGNTKIEHDVSNHSLIVNENENLQLNQHNDSSVVIANSLATKATVQPNKKSHTQADANDFFSWMSERGHFSRQEREDYEHYDQKTLEALAERGDLKALDALGDLYLNNSDLNMATIYFERGAIRGSTFAIETLGIMAQPDFNTEEDDRRFQILESLAITKIGALRGEEERAEMDMDALIKSYERLYHKKLDLTAEDQQKIDQRAAEIFNTWQDKRREMGLGDFDNSQPRGVKNFFGLFK